MITWQQEFREEGRKTHAMLLSGKHPDLSKKMMNALDQHRDETYRSLRELDEFISSISNLDPMDALRACKDRRKRLNKAGDFL